jgi:short-subunit dehydrogenase
LNGIAVISGTTHGIGRVTSLELAKAGYTVVMLCRDLTAARNVRDEILAQVPGAALHVIRCDLASFSSVRECAHALRGAIDQITLLINNASARLIRSRNLSTSCIHLRWHAAWLQHKALRISCALGSLQRTYCRAGCAF